MLNKASSLRKFQRVTLRDEAYASIKQAILLSEFSQGQQLAIAALSEVTGLSATPIREALLMLEREGLVDRLPKGHFIVRRVSRQEVAEICQVRSLLEPFAARLALGNLKEPDIHHLEENVARSREALAEEDMALLTELNTEFHDYLNGLAKNETLNGITRLLREKVLQTRSTALWVPGKAKTAIRQHLAMIEALRKNDGDLLEKLIIEHVETAREIILEHQR